RVLKCLLGFEYARFCPCIAEAYAIREALSWLKTLSLDNVLIKSNRLLLFVSALSYPLSDAYQLGNPFISANGLVICRPHGMRYSSHDFV
ncbi:hypothetical protein Golob_024158, partial [Gossypium lobatum]|nr:hypothetical protein [Gossypium lobatum]